MKILICLLIQILAFNLAVAQPGNPPVDTGVALPGGEPAKLLKFSIDFPGGTPKQLVTAMEKAIGRPINAIILEEHANAQIPPLKMNNVDVPQLFLALQTASSKTMSFGQQSWRTTYGFRTQGNVSEDTIWTFYVDKPASPPLQVACRFYPLSGYLTRGVSVDDITTAIQTAWRMMGDSETPNISYHKDTKLLIAVGESSKLEIIDSALQALEMASEQKKAVDAPKPLPPTPKSEK